MSNILNTITIGDILILTVDSDPTVGGGVNAPIGSLILVSNGSSIYFKSNSGNTNWDQQVSTSTLGSITAVGTITSGIWNGSVISPSYGGTGINNTGTLTYGANNITFTTSGPTSLILPTSGTLVNTGVSTLSSLSTVGTITSGTWNGTPIANVYLANSSLTINGTSVSLGGTYTITSAAGTLTGATLSASVVTSSLTSVGTITSGTWNGTTITIANGGTGQITANAGLNALLPSQTGNNGLFLQTNGTNTSWIAATSALLTGYVSGAGTVSASDSILSAIQKLNGNIALATGAIVFQGLWNANTNTPTLTSGTGTTGWMYKVSVAGSTTLDGISQWNIGDQLFFDGTHWDKIDGIANEVLSVNGLTGAVALTGTAGQITISGSNVFAIAGTYVGQTSITTLGTITTGVWNGTAITNGNLANSSITIGSTAISLGSSSTTLAGLSSVTSTTFVGALSGNASTASTLQTGRTINGTTFDGSTNITITAAAGTLTGTTLNATVVTSSLTSVGTITSGTWNASIIGPTYGGTGMSSYISGQIIYSPSLNSLTTLNIGSTGQVLTVSGGLPVWSTPTVGTVTSVSIVTNQGVSGSVATSTTTPAITLTLGALTGVTSFNGLIITANTGVVTTGTWNGTIIGSAYGGTGVNNGSSTITLAGNLATSGTNSLTLTTTGTTNVTLPTSGTLVNLSGTQTLSNKTLDDTNIITVKDGSFTIQNSTDTTKQLIFSLSGITTSTTRTLTAPNVSGTIITSGDTGTVTNTMLVNSSLTVNGTLISLGGSGAVTAAAGTLTGTTLNATVVTSSLTSVGTIGTGVWQGTAIADTYIGSSANWNTAYTNRISSLTTTGSSGAATLISNVLNIPNYTLAGLGGQPLSSNLTSLSGLTYVSTSFVKMTGANTFTLDTNTYLTANQTITLSGGATGSGTTAITVTLSNSAVTGQVLTGYVSGAGTVSATDSILGAIQKLNGNIALVTGAVVYQGTWNANTNTPTLTSGVGTKGFLYKVSVAGSTSIDGISQWNVGDSIVFDGTVWDKIDGISNEVISVFGRTGAVVATNGDYNTSQVTENTNLYFTNARVDSRVQSYTGNVTLTGTVFSIGSSQVANSMLVNSSMTIGSTSISLGTTVTTFAGVTLTAPTINGGTVTAITSLGIRSTGTGAFDLTIANSENLTAGRTLTITTNDAARTINLGGNITTAAAFITSGANSLTLTTTGTTNVTLPTSGTLITTTVTTLSSLVSVGTITTGVWNGTAIANANLANSSLTVNGTLISLGGSGTITSAAGTLTGTTLNSTVVTSSLTAIGTITSGGLGTGAVIGGVTMTLGSDASYDTYYRNSSGVLTRLGNGTTGQVLTATTGAAPSWTAPATSGTVTSVSVVTNQGVSGSVATATTTPAITLTLGALTGVTSINGLVITANTGVITTGTWNASVIGATYGGTGVNNGVNTITLAGNLVTSGANSLTLTTTGTTNVTLPTSGTLVNTAVTTLSSLVSIGTITTGVWNGSTIAIANGGTNAITSLAAFNNLSPLTTVGDLLSFNGTNNIRVGIGTSGLALVSDSTQSAGINWTIPTVPKILSFNFIILTSNSLIIADYMEISLSVTMELSLDATLEIT